MQQRRVIVVGGGIAGLTAARDLVALGHHVLLLESAPAVGGKIRRGEVAGVTVDVGAEAMVNRRPEGVALARDLGLAVVHPTLASSRIWTRGELRPLPRTLMGAPLDLGQLGAAGLLSTESMARAAMEFDLPPEVIDDDVSVGDLVARRFGDEVTDRLVEPLLGGVYAGHARAISARAAMPQLVDLARRGSVLTQARTLPVSDSPVFAGITGGMGVLVERLADGLDVRTDATVRELSATLDGFRLVTGSTTDPVAEHADAVVLATPAAPTARLLAGVAPAAATELDVVEYASMAVVTLAFRASDAPELAGTTASGFLVPPVDGRSIKAATFSFSKWGWVRDAGRARLDGDDVLLLRTSMGRHGEEATLQRTDDELVTASLADLATATGLSATPVDTRVQRWGGGLPQYALGHLDRVARIRAAVALVPGLAVCGAAYDGVGIAACIASGHRAAAAVVKV